jgi:hypothetical protein
LPAYFTPFGAPRYDAVLFGLAGRRIAESIVALFALLGFAFVPLGKKTALEHALDIFTTPAAQNAWIELAGATARLKDKVINTVLPSREPQATPPIGATPQVPELPNKARRH